MEIMAIFVTAQWDREKRLEGWRILPWEHWLEERLNIYLQVEKKRDKCSIQKLDNH